MAKRPAAPEGQGNNVNPDDYAAYFRDMQHLEADMGRLKQRMATTHDRYEKMGCNRAAMKEALKQANKDPEKAKTQRAINRYVLDLLEITDEDERGQYGFGKALDPKVNPEKKLTVEAQAKLAAAKAYNDGHNSAMAGGDLEANRHEAGTETYVRWVEGFHDGHKQRLEKNPNADKVTNAQPRKRGRPAKNSAASPSVEGDDMGAPVGNA